MGEKAQWEGAGGDISPPPDIFLNTLPYLPKHAPIPPSFPKSPYCPCIVPQTHFSLQPINLSSRIFKALLCPFSCVWCDSAGKCCLVSWGFGLARGEIRASYRPHEGVKADFAAARLTLHRGSRGKVTCLGMAWRRGIRLPLALGSGAKCAGPGVVGERS